MPVRTLLAVAALATALPASAADLPPGFVAKTFTNTDGSESPYVVYVPPKYTGKTAVPVVLFLHGSGESKGGAMMPIEQGIGNGYITLRAKTFPAIVVFPQAEAVAVAPDKRWAADSPDGQRAMAILDEVTREYKCDPKRVYLTGLSMGGTGVWSLAAAYPDRWAALAPICGSGKVETAAKIKAIPCWCFHGHLDTTVPVQRSRSMVAALQQAGGKPVYTEFRNVGHKSWDKVYEADDFYKWLFAQKKR